MEDRTRPPGRTQIFVNAQGFKQIGNREVLVDAAGHGRVFLELSTDADLARSDPEAAYKHLLTTMEPGAQIRFLQIHWPDAGPREDFTTQTFAWPQPEHSMNLPTIAYPQ
jgi:hypothetical protein